MQRILEYDKYKKSEENLVDLSMYFMLTTST
jgi:hypothetical protein